MMKFGLSPITDTIYYGQVNEKRPNEWVGNKKKDVTDEVIAVVYQWFMSKFEHSEDEPLVEYSITFPSTDYELVMRRKNPKKTESNDCG